MCPLGRGRNAGGISGWQALAKAVFAVLIHTAIQNGDRVSSKAAKPRSSMYCAEKEIRPSPRAWSIWPSGTVDAGSAAP
ncbi:hypothetical protein LK08_24515 [Streptomyces sp. MUSC 125]|nr:hypothetical protein LK08_24515 [Streptomyces sp. MUSC 125]